MDYKALYEQSQVKISQLEQQRVMIREQEMFDNIEKDESKRLKAVADRNRKTKDILGAKIEVAKLKKENEELKAFINQLKVNVVKLEEVDPDEEDPNDYYGQD